LGLFLIASHTHHRICLAEGFSKHSGGITEEGAYHMHGKIFSLQGLLSGSRGISCLCPLVASGGMLGGKTAALLSVNARVVPLLWLELWKGFIYRQVPRKPRLVSGDKSAQFKNNKI
jgi:hypothetical protein